MIVSKKLSTRAKQAVILLVSRLRVDFLLQNSVYIMISTALMGASGYLYWIIAARAYPARDVGLAAALVGAMTLSATLANLGIGPTLIQVLPSREAGYPWSLTLNAVLATGILASLLAGSAAAIILPFLSPTFDIVGYHSGYILALIASIPLLTLVTLMDFTFTAERAPGKMLACTAMFAVMRLPFLLGLIVLGWTSTLAICASWVLAAGVSLIGAVSLVPRLGRAYRLAWRGLITQMRATFSLVAGHQLISLGALAPIYLLPVVVVARLSAEQNAYFYTSWQVGSLFFMVSPSVAVALLVEGSHTPHVIYRKGRSSVLIIAALLGPAMLLTLLGGRLILSIFGPNYALNGYSLLAVLVLSAIPDAITNVYVAVLRVRTRFGQAALLNLGMAALSLVLAWSLLPRMGIVGAGWAWLIAQTAGALVVAAHVIVAGIRTRGGNLRRHTQARTTARRITRIMLIVDPCSAGEALRIAPYVALVRDHHPDAEITLVANEDALQTLERVEGLDCVVTSNLYRYRPYSRVRIRMCQVRTWLGLMWRLGIGYDLVITFYWGGVLQHLLGYVASRGRRVGHAHYSRLLSRWLLSCSLGPFEWDASHPPQHAALLRAAGLDVGEFVRPSIRHTDEDTIAISQLLQEHHVAVERLIVLHPGSDWACQQWFSACWAELADELVSRYRADVVFTGTASEAAYIEDIRHLMARLSVSLAGQTTLPQLAMLLRSAWLCICVDSAIFELTQATSTPAVVLAGPSRPETGIYGARQPIVIRRMSDQLAGTIVACQGRHNALNETGCWNYHCPMAGLRTIQVADVLAAVACQIQAG